MEGPALVNQYGQHFGSAGGRDELDLHGLLPPELNVPDLLTGSRAATVADARGCVLEAFRPPPATGDFLRI